MAEKSYKGVTLPPDLIDLVDRFVDTNDWGYRTRAEVAASAIRSFLMEHGVVSQAQLREMQIQRLKDEERADVTRD